MSFCCINCFFCCLRIYNRIFYKKLLKQKVPTSSLPWLWIGAETTNGKIETVTEVVNSIIDFEDIITPLFLQEITNLKNVKRWLYLNPTTLNEEEIPAEGLVIKDDSSE
jgi:hypothetical protein